MLQKTKIPPLIVLTSGGDWRVSVGSFPVKLDSEVLRAELLDDDGTTTMSASFSELPKPAMRESSSSGSSFPSLAEAFLMLKAVLFL